MRPEFFGEPDGPLYGVLYSPTQESSRGVLVCPPIGQEYIRSHMALGQLGKRLNRKGFHFYKFDYAGTGDSFGDLTSTSWDTWKKNVQQAALHFVESQDLNELIIIGMRIGSLLVLEIVDELAKIVPLKKVLLWDPPADGTKYLQNLENLQWDILKRGDDLIPYPKGDSFGPEDQLLGYVLPQSIKDEIKKLSLEWVKCDFKRVSIISTSPEVDSNSDLASNFEKIEMNSPCGWNDYRFIQKNLNPSQVINKIYALV
jgi:pimeloyl-ACP methyl ester carboxylesterase